MHLHGFPMKIVERDGFPLAQPYLVDTVTVAPGERYDVIVEPDAEGVWAFPCHLLSHAESEHGMHGMVTVLIVQ
jgi:FtsP/CotA-like multicopper oxidase with cupredoxin domain